MPKEQVHGRVGQHVPKAPSWWYHSLAPRPAAWATLVLPLRLGCPTHGPTPFCGAPRIRHYHHTEKPRNKISTIIRCSIGPPCGTTHGGVSPACIEDANVCSCVASLLNNYRWDYEEGVSKDRPGRCADDTSSLLRLFPHALEYSRVREEYEGMNRRCGCMRVPYALGFWIGVVTVLVLRRI